MKFMKPTRLLLPAALALVSAPLATSFAQTEATTIPVGYVTFTIPGSQTTAISLPLHEPPIGSGAVVGVLTEVGSNFLDNINAGWTAGAFSNASAPHFVQITSGAAAGRFFQISTSTANTATRLTVLNDGINLTTLGIVAGADTYKIFPGDTLFSLFGSDTLQGGTQALGSDNIQVWNGSSWLIFYYNTTRGRWERNTDTAASPSRDTFVLRPDRGLMVRRFAPSTISLTVLGQVTTTNFQTFHSRPGATFLASGFPVDMTLGQLAMQSAQVNNTWRGWNNYSTALANADILQIWNGSSWLNFYFDTNNNRWQRANEASQTDRNGFVVQAGRPIMLLRRSSGSDNTTDLPIPYSL
jgi:uncharacterized protein (TIGR02597 family)